MGMARAYSVLEIKAVDDDKRIISGIATTPTPDRMGDIIEPLGAKFQNPMPLLWQHRVGEPVGQVTFEKPTSKGIKFTARMPRLSADEEAGKLKERLDEAWASVKLDLVRAVSIGFRAIEYSFMEDGGIHYLETEIVELSLVTIPAQADAKIETIKAIDAPLLAASGLMSSESDRPKPPGVTGKSKSKLKGAAMKTIAEQIASFEATRATKIKEMDDLLAKSGESGETLDAEDQEQYDTLDAEVKSIDAHLVRLRSAEARAKATAKPVNGEDRESASESRTGHREAAPRVRMRPNVEKGTGFVRAVWCKIHGAMHNMNPADVAKAQPWHDQTPEVELFLRAPVTPGSTTTNTWGGYLSEAQTLAAEFAELLRPATIIGRIPGLTRVPFNVKVNRETTAASVGWVGEAGVKPVSAMAFDQISLAHNKVAGIVPITEELFRFSSPAVEGLIRQSLIGSISQLLDSDLLDPTKSEVVGVSPASLTNGVTPIAATGTNADALRADLGTLIAAYIALNQNLAGLVLVMTSTQAMRIAMMRNTLGQREFEGITREGGTLEGIPVVASENMVSTGGSPANGGMIVAVNAPEVLLADDGEVSVDMSREASLQMDTAPDSPTTASTVLVSLWQRNMIALKAERFITWKKRRTGAVQFINYAKYA